MPRHFIWNNSVRAWQRAKRGRDVAGQPGVVTTGNIGRMYTVSPRMGDCFYLRLLLVNVRGPTSFELLRTVDGVLRPTFKDACLARGLLEDDAHWRLTMREAAATRMPAALRRLFAAILTHGDPSDPAEIWREFREDMMSDLLRHGWSAEEAEGRVLRRLAARVEAMGGAQLLSAYGLPDAPAETCDVSSAGLTVGFKARDLFYPHS